MKSARLAAAFRVLGQVLFSLLAVTAWGQQVVKTVTTAANPTQIVVNPASDKWFAALGTFGWVMGDGTTGAVTTFPTFGDEIKFGAVNPVANRVYFVRNGTFSMAVDASTGANSPSYNLGTIDAIVVNPVTGYYYMLHKAVDQVTWFDANDSGSISAVTKPAIGAANGATNTLYFASNAVDATLTKMSGTTHLATGSVQMSKPGLAMTANPVSNKVYVTTASTDLLVFDGTTLLEATPVTVCFGGTAVAVNPNTERIYVVCPGDTVTVVDGATNTVVGTVPVGDLPGAVAVDIVANKVYVANQGDGTVTVIDGADNTTQTITVGTSPVGIALNPVTGKVFVANSGSSNVSVIDRSSYTQTNGPNGILVATNPVAGRVYVVEYAAAVVHALDAATGLIVGTSALEAFGAGAIGVDPVLSKVYVTRSNGSVAIFSGSNAAFLGATPSVPGGADYRSIAVNPVTHKVYMSDFSVGSARILDGITNTYLATLPLPGPSQAIAVDPVTNRAYATVQGNNSVAVIDGATDTVIKTIGVGAGPTGVAVNSATNRIYVANMSSSSVSEIIGSTVDDPSPTVNTFTFPNPYNGNACCVAVNPSTNQVFVGVQNNVHVAVIDVGTSGIDYVAAGDVFATDMAIDPVRNVAYVVKFIPGALAIIDGHAKVARTVGVGSNPRGVAVDPTTGKAYVGRTNGFTGDVRIIDPAPSTFPQHKPSLVSGGFGTFGKFTTSPGPSLTLGISGLYSTPDPAVQSMRFRQGDSQGAHTVATPLAGPNGTYTANLTGLTKGLNYVSAFALDAMSGSSISSESGGVGASPAITGAPVVLALVLIDPPLISPATLPNGRIGVPYTESVGASGGLAPYTFAGGGSLPPGVSFAPNGTFSGTPTSAGLYGISVTATDSLGASGTVNYALTIDPNAVIGTNPAANVTFPNQPMGYPSAAQLVTVTSAGTSNLVVGAPSITGLNVGDFAIHSNNCATVPPTQSCAIEIKFTPQALGARTASLDIPSNDPDTPVKSLALSGTGAAVDDMPAAFAFTDVSGVARSSVQTSNIITVTGLNVPAQISISGSGAFSIGCNGTFGTNTTTVVNSDTVCVQHLSSSSNGGVTNTTLSIGSIAGTVSDTFTSTTIAGFALNVATGGAGTGSVSGTGINCPGDCSEMVDSGTVVSLTASPAAGSAFGTWSGCTSTVGTQCSVTVGSNLTVTATFTLIQYTVTPSAGANGTIAPSAAQTVNHGATTSFTVTPSAGYTAVVGGTCGGSLVGSTYTTNAITANCTVSATFTQVTYTVTPSAGANGSISPSTPQTVGHGATTSFTVTPNAGYATAAVTGCGGSLAGNTYTTAAITANCTVTAGFAIVNPPRLGNISTRMQVLTGNDVMIGGFVIGGATTKRVAIVATGPSLSAFGITNPLANPTLTLVRSSDQAVIATSDDWQTAANQADLTAAGFAPSNTLEAAILADLAPGAYTAIVSGAGGLTGVSVIGVYEVNHPETPLINISTRGRVLTGNDVMIGGFIINGSGPQTLAIVATGPSLAAFGITSPLANPTITLVRSSDQAVLATNDDWQTDASASQLQAAGFAPSNALEAALLVTLPPGAYTAIVQGVGGGTGVAVIGVYKVQ